MTDTIYKYRVWCTTDNKWVESWGATLPTTCAENNTHTIDSTKTTIIDQISAAFPSSDAGNKIVVHSTPRPMMGANTLYSYWTGSGDDVINHIIGAGTPAVFALTPGTPSVSVDIEFDVLFGEVYIHEGSFLWRNAGIGDYVSAEVIAKASPITTYVSHDLVIDSDNYILYSSGGPGTGTHGFAATPHLLPRPFSKDGDWNYDGVSLTPNFTKTGGYKISSQEHIIHRFMNKVMLVGSSDSYMRMVSHESTQIYAGYIIRITCHNISNTTWQGTAMITAFRDSTAKP